MFLKEIVRMSLLVFVSVLIMMFGLWCFVWFEIMLKMNVIMRFMSVKVVVVCVCILVILVGLLMLNWFEIVR